MSFFFKKKSSPPPPAPNVPPPAVQASITAVEGDTSLKNRQRRRTKSILTSTRGAVQDTLGGKTLLGA